MRPEKLVVTSVQFLTEMTSLFSRGMSMFYFCRGLDFRAGSVCQAFAPSIEGNNLSFFLASFHRPTLCLTCTCTLDIVFFFYIYFCCVSLGRNGSCFHSRVTPSKRCSYCLYFSAENHFIHVFWTTVQFHS